MRRHVLPLLGKRFCGNTNKMEVHDLDQEDVNGSGCQIDEIMASDHAKSFIPDSLDQAHTEGFDNCAKCLGGSHW